MNILNIFKRKPEPKQQQLRGPLPFIHLLGGEKAYGHPPPQDYKNQVQQYKSWAFACAQKNAFSVAKCKLKIYLKVLRDNKIELEEITEHPFIDLFNNVNPTMNRFELLSITQLFLELTGNSYWWMPRDSLRTPMMIWSIPSHWMKIVPSETSYVEGYLMEVPGKGVKVPLPEDEVVHFKFPSPFDLFYGTGPLFAAQYGIDLNNHIKTWGINFFMNNAVPSGILYTDDSLHRDQYQRLHDEWNRKYKGSSNAGKIAVLEAGLKYQQTGSTLKDSKFDDVSRDIRDEILAMFGVPASKLGLVEDVNRANADANDYTYQKETVEPRLVLMDEKINEKIMPIYDTRIVAKFESPVPEDKEFRLRERIENIRSGYSSIDDERLKDGEKPYNLPQTQTPIIPFGSIEQDGMTNEEDTDESEESDTDQDDDDKDSEEKKSVTKSERREKAWTTFAKQTGRLEGAMGLSMRRFFAEQHRDLIRNLNKYRSVNKDVKAPLIELIRFNLKQENLRLKTKTRSHVLSAAEVGAKSGLAEGGNVIDWSLYNPNVIRHVDTRLEFFSDRVNRSTLKYVEKEINTAIKNGETIDDIAKRLERINEFNQNFRSRTVAQTEIIGATNDAKIKAMKESGIKQKEWVTARDENVRDSHLIDGQIQDIDQPFVLNSGAKINSPGDRSSCDDASETINCRCTIVRKE